MKVSTYIFALILIFLVVLQNIGGRYGSYVVFSWIWLLIALSPLFLGWLLKRPKQISPKHLIYFIILTFLILIQPSIKAHPILILGGSIVLIIPFMTLELLKVKQSLGIQTTKLDKGIIDQCKKLIGENRIEMCFELLLTESKDEKFKQTILFLKQKWNQNKKEKNLSLNTNEWIDVQNSKTVNELLNILNTESISKK